MKTSTDSLAERLSRDSEITLTITGRKSGRAISTPVWFVWENGTVYLLPVNDHYQLADIGYYVSGNYYTSITLYEVWPIQSGDKTGSLVWRGDYFAAPTLAFTKGTERIAYGALMLQDIKKEIRFFQDDLKASR